MLCTYLNKSMPSVRVHVHCNYSLEVSYTFKHLPLNCRILSEFIAVQFHRLISTVRIRRAENRQYETIKARKTVFLFIRWRLDTSHVLQGSYMKPHECFLVFCESCLKLWYFLIQIHWWYYCSAHHLEFYCYIKNAWYFVYPNKGVYLCTFAFFRLVHCNFGN